MMAGIKYWDLLQGYNICHYIPVTPPPPPNSPSSDIQGMYKVHNMSLSSLQMPKIELHRPGIEPGLPALQAGTLPKELSTLYL